VAVDHFQQGMIQTPVLESMMSLNANYKVLLEESRIAAGVPASLKESVRDPLVMCVSASEESASNACEGEGIAYWNPTSRQFQSSDATVLMSGDDFVNQVKQQQQEHAVFNLLRSFMANGGSAKYNAGAIELSLGSASTRFDLANEADMLFLMELHMMASLPERLSKDARIMDESPDFFALTVSGLRTVAETYGEDSVNYKIAVAVVDSAVEQVVQNFENLMPNQLVSQVVFADTYSGAVSATARRLLQAPAPAPATFTPVAPVEVQQTCIDFTPSGEPCPPTLGEIERVQLFFWTLVILIIMLLMSTCCLCNMDVGRDSLLYAKFITEHNKAD